MLAALLDLACPRFCAGCGVRGALLCDPCAVGVLGSPFPADPTPRPAGLPPVYASTAYDGPARAALIAFKERGRLGLAGPLAAALASAVAVTGADLLVAVPSSRAARRTRGYDHTAMLAKRAAAQLGLGVLGGLAQPRRVSDQAGLGTQARTANLAGSMQFAGRAPAVGARVVIVDDIVTSGATLADAARALRCAGIDVAAAAVVAATQRRSQLYKAGPAG
ncbi:MAG: phosphoribosyltransferase family protein [Mycobacteriales bacterium]